MVEKNNRLRAGAREKFYPGFEAMRSGNHTMKMRVNKNAHARLSQMVDDEFDKMNDGLELDKLDFEPFFAPDKNQGLGDDLEQLEEDQPKH